MKSAREEVRSRPAPVGTLRIASQGVFFVGGQSRRRRRPDLHVRADVRPLSGPGRAADGGVPVVMRRRGPTTDDHVHRHPEIVGLGGRFLEPRLSGLRRRSARPRPLALHRQRLRCAGCAGPARPRAALHGDRARQALASGGAPQPVARRRCPRRRGVRPVLRLAVGRHECHEPGAVHQPGPHRAARQDRAMGAAHPLAVEAARLARRTPGPTW